MEQALRRQTAGRVDAARPQQDHAVDARRRLERRGRRSATERIAEDMCLLDAEFVEQAEHRAGEIAERIGAVDGLGRAAVAWHVRDDQPEFLGQRRNVACEIRLSRRPGTAAVEEKKRSALADFGDKYLTPGDLNCSGGLACK